MASEPKTYNADEARSFVEDMSYGLKFDEREIQVLAFYIEVASKEIDSMRIKLQQITNLNPKVGDCIVKIEYLGLDTLAQMMLGEELRSGHLRVEFRIITENILEQIKTVILGNKSEIPLRWGIEFYPMTTESPVPGFINQNRLKELLADLEANSEPITGEQLDRGW